MKHQTFAIWDSAAGAFLPPFHMPREEQAIRAFKDCVNSPSHQFGAHPYDYTLMHLGEFDDCSGIYTQSGKGRAVITGLAARATARVDENQVQLNLVQEDEA